MFFSQHKLGLPITLPLILLLAMLLHMPAGLAFEAGTAKVDITPPIGTPLNGYGDRMGRPATHVHDPLWARAVFLDDGTTQVVLVNTDLCAINSELREAVLEKAPAHIPPQNIILTATHTHNGPGATTRYLPIRFVSGQYMPEVLEELSTKIAQSIEEAYGKRERAAIGYGTATQTVLSTNRRVPGGPIDEQIGVIRVDNADGDALAIIANFAAHPTSVVRDDHYGFSADYPGFYYNEIERLSSEGCVALFLNGAEGNQSIANPEDKSGWARTESVGRLLAVSVKGVANEIECSEAELKVYYSEPTLPKTLASAFMPSSTVLQSLEIGDLILHFWPGEPVVELGLALRKEALAAGYAAQFSVGLANDTLLYFVPPDMYQHFHYESAQNYYGPGIQDWFIEQFAQLSPRMTPQSRPALDEVNITNSEGPWLRLEGDAYTRGLQQGAVWQEQIHTLYKERIEAPVRSGDYLPTTGIWAQLPRFIDPTALALPMMAMAARPLLTQVSPEARLEMEGMAAASGLPFDALWLLQSAAYLPNVLDKTPLFQTPLCTMFAVTGERAGADDLLVGRNLDWTHQESPAILEVYPTQGIPYIQVGFGWNSGVFTGMNAAGLTLALQRDADTLPTALESTPIEFILKSILQEVSNVDTAIARLRAVQFNGPATILVAGKNQEGAATAQVLELGATTKQRSGEEGLLLGTLPESDQASSAAASRYSRVRALLADERIVGSDEIAGVLQDAPQSREMNARILNEHTRHSVIVEPLKRRIKIAFPDEQGAMGAYTTYTLEDPS